MFFIIIIIIIIIIILKARKVFENQVCQHGEIFYGLFLSSTLCVTLNNVDIIRLSKLYEVTQKFFILYQI